MEKPCVDCPRYMPGYEKCSGNCEKYLNWFCEFWRTFTAKLRRQWGSTGNGHRPIKTDAFAWREHEQRQYVVIYRVFLTKTGKQVAEGTALECAEVMGMSRKTFHGTVSKVRHGQVRKWRIETREEVRL